LSTLKSRSTIWIVATLLGCPSTPDTSNWTRLSGTLDLRQSRDDETTCEATIALLGTPTDCEELDLAFAITSGIDAQTGDCAFPAPHSLLPIPPAQPPLLGVAETWTIGDETWRDVLLGGLSIDMTPSGGAVTGPLWTPLAWDDPDAPGALSVDGDTLRWSWSRETTTRTESHRDLCQAAEWITAGGDASDAKWSVTDSLPCGDWTADGTLDGRIDVWSITTVAGQPMSIAVDTLSQSTAFDPWMWVSDGAGCVLGEADAGFPCAHGSADCPGLELSPDGSSLTVAVASWGGCADVASAYRLRVETNDSPEILLVSDDVPRWDETVTATEIELEGRLWR